MSIAGKVVVVVVVAEVVVDVVVVLSVTSRVDYEMKLKNILKNSRDCNLKNKKP